MHTKKIILLCIIFFGVTFYSVQIYGQSVTPLPSRQFQVTSNKPAINSFQSPSISFQDGIFGGKITNLKAKQIENYENAGYDCKLDGTSIEIRPIKGNYSFIIPNGVRNIARHSIQPGQSIIGRNRGSMNVNCKKCVQEGDEQKCSEVNFNLPTIVMFSTSRI